LKVTEVRTIVTCPGRNFVLVKILTDEGLYGVGDATLNGRELAVAEALREHIGPWLIEKEAERIEDIWQELFRGTYWRGGPVLMTALAGVDLALWDVKGKKAGMPLYELFGGRTRDKVRVYMHPHGRTFEETLESCKRVVRMGCTALRASVDIPGLAENQWEPAPYLRTTPRLFKYLREQLGDEVDFLHDVHERINPVQACQLAKDLEPIRMFFLEDPLRPEHKESFRLLRAHTSTPIAMGELYHDIWECLPLVTEQLVDFLRVDICHFGGITHARKLAAIAEPYYIDMAFHGPGDISPIVHAANVHIDTSIPNFGIQEWVFHGAEVKKVVTGGPEYKDGYLTAPNVSGLGCDINEEEAARYPYKRDYLPTLRRLDGSFTDW